MTSESEPILTGLTSNEDGWLIDPTAEEDPDVFILDVGTYELVETKAPTGYQLRTTPVKIIVTSAAITYDDGSVISSDSTGISYDETELTYEILITNSAGVILPSTGGRGARWFYITGSVLALSSGTALFLRQKKKRRKRPYARGKP